MDEPDRKIHTETDIKAYLRHAARTRPRSRRTTQVGRSLHTASLRRAFSHADDFEPLRKQWDATYAAAIQLDEEDKRKDAIKLLRQFHGKLCETRVLDPACGSGNFLYVSMELMKRLEGEVVSAMASFGDHVLPGITIDPHQFLGIEINPRAAALAELVLWIGFIQWHRRTRNEIAPPEPILKDYKNIECRDAVMDWDDI